MTIFVSYSREDHKCIQVVLTELRDNGFDLWIDEEGIEGAAFWRKEIVEAIEASSAVLFFATEASCKSDAVFKELALANEENKPILPVLLANIKLPSDLRYQVAGIQNINLSTGRERGIRNIITSLSRITNTDINKTSKIENDPIKTDITKHGILKSHNIGLIVGAFSLLLVTSIYLYMPSISNDVSHNQPEEITFVSEADNLIKQETRSIEEAPIEKIAPEVPTQINIPALRALVIGNGRYEQVPLANTVNDAKDVADLLKSLGFDVTELIDLPRDKLLQSIRNHYASISSTRGLSMPRKTKGNRVVHMVYYSGHSIEIDGIQYIVPIDSGLSQMNNFRAQLISIKEIMPDRYGINVENNYTLYSTEPGGLAMDGDRTNSPFTKAFLKGLSNPSLDLFGVFTQVRQSVKVSTHGKQIPWIAASADQPLWLGDKSRRNIKGGASIVVLDGCRNNPLKATLR